MISLAAFGISEKTGFVPEKPPLAKLPGEYFAPWEDLVSQLPELNRTKQLRTQVHQLPHREFSGNTLKSEEEWRRAYVVLCFLGQSYIWGEGEKGLVDKVPEKLAIPWCAISEHLHLKPVICYAATSLFNFCLHDPNGPWNADNLSCNSSFTGLPDESWFYIVTAPIELAAVPALRAIGCVFDDMAQGRNSAVYKYLLVIQQSLQEMRKAMSRMYERCKPAVFFVNIRPFQAGSRGISALPEGIIYEGVDSKPRLYHGASAGQSSIIPFFDIVFGVRHFGSAKEFLDAMRTYMPHKHREFLNALEDKPSIRDYCKKSKDLNLITSFNDAVEELAAFRSDHVVLVTRYIVNQRGHSINPALDSRGSGGTDFMRFLKEVRNATNSIKIENPKSGDGRQSFPGPSPVGNSLLIA